MTLSWLGLAMSLLAMAPVTAARHSAAQDSVRAFADTAPRDSQHAAQFDSAGSSDTTPVLTASHPMQFRSGGHVLGFTSEGYLVAGRDHLLQVNFVGAADVAPVASTEPGPNTAAAPPIANGQVAAALDEVHYRNLWPGIDLRYDGGNGILRSTYTLAPGANTADIRLAYNVPVTLTAAGTLSLAFATGTLSETAPIAWQDIKGRRTSITVAFQKHDNGELGFVLGDYDPALPLRIDPTLTWHLFLGGTGTDVGSGIATDAAGNIYVTGRSDGSWGAPVRPFAGLNDAFVARFDPSGTLSWSTFLGSASSEDFGLGIATGAAESVYVTGVSGATWGIPLRPFGGGFGFDAFVARVDASSGTLTWHTFLGGSNSDEGRAIATDAAGNVLVSGFSDSSWGAPLRPYAGGGLFDTFVARLDAAGALTWNTFLGGATTDFSFGIATDAIGNVYVTGRSVSTWGSPLRAHAGGGNDAYVARLSTAGTLIWNTFLGGLGADDSRSIATGAVGGVYVTGTSTATWGTPVSPYAGAGYVARLATSGALIWHTFLGASSADLSFGIATDSVGGVHVTGRSSATWGSPVRPYAGGNDAFVARLDAAGTLSRSTFLGGSGNDNGAGIATDAAGNVYATGDSNATWGAPLRPHSGGQDAYVVRLAGSSPFAYITNELSNSVSVINTGTNTVVGTVAVGMRPFGVAVKPGGTHVYVANTTGDDVSVIDTNSNTVIATVSVGDFPLGIAVNSAGTRVYVANGNSDSVSVIDTATNTVIAPPVQLGNEARPFGVAVNPAGTRVYVANANNHSVSVIDTATHTVVSTVTAAMGIGMTPRGVVVNPAGTRVYVGNATSNTVSVIDTTTNAVIATVPVGSFPQGIAINPAGTHVYVSNQSSGSVSVIDTATHTVLAPPITVGTSPQGITVNPAGTLAYVANFSDNNVSVIDLTNNTVITSVPVGTSPGAFGVAIAPNAAVNDVVFGNGFE